MIFVFTTSVQTQGDIERLKPYLDKNLPDSKWNFDLEDCDNIFRVDTPLKDAASIEKLLVAAGYLCEELPY